VDFPIAAMMQRFFVLYGIQQRKLTLSSLRECLVDQLAITHTLVRNVNYLQCRYHSQHNSYWRAA
jgi:hypothetical protein